MPVTIGRGTILVLSNLPPTPTSSIVASTLRTCQRIWRDIIAQMLTFSEANTWNASRVMKRKYAGFDVVAGLARCRSNKYRYWLLHQIMVAYFIIGFQSVPYVEEVSSEHVFGYRYAINAYTFSYSNKMRRSVQSCAVEFVNFGNADTRPITHQHSTRA